MCPLRWLYESHLDRHGILCECSLLVALNLLPTFSILNLVQTPSPPSTTQLDSPFPLPPTTRRHRDAVSGSGPRLLTLSPSVRDIQTHFESWSSFSFGPKNHSLAILFSLPPSTPSLPLPPLPTLPPTTTTTTPTLTPPSFPSVSYVRFTIRVCVSVCTSAILSVCLAAWSFLFFCSLAFVSLV